MNMLLNTPERTDELLRLNDMFKNYLKPLISEVNVSGPHIDANSNRMNQAVVYDTKHVMKIYFSTENDAYFMLKRPIPFSIEEKIFLEDIVRQIYSIHAMRENLRSKAPEIVEHAIALNVNPGHADMVFRLIRVYSEWLEKGVPPPEVSQAVGIYFNKNKNNGESFFELSKQDYMKKVGTAAGVMITVTNNGMVLKQESIPVTSNNHKYQQIYAPLAFTGLAAWTDARHKAVIKLTSKGEILIFKNKKLLFVKKNNRWRCLPHSLVINNFIAEDLGNFEKNLREAAYLTALDLGFYYRKCHLIIVSDQKIIEGKYSFLLPAKDIPALIKNLINGRKFFQIPRTERTELCLVCGTVVLDKEGNIIAITNGGIKEENIPVNEVKNLLNQCDACVKVFEDGEIEPYKN